MRPDEAKEVVIALQNHAKDDLALSQANDWLAAQGANAKTVIIGEQRESLKGFLADINYFGVTKKKLNEAEIITVEGDALKLNVGKLAALATQAVSQQPVASR